eukprot:scaffold88914_cov54-Phaeocystis_antarctica.AAC.2
MKIAMLLIWVLFLATAVEALPGGGGRQLGEGKGNGAGRHRWKARASCRKWCQNKVPGLFKKKAICMRSCMKG